MKCNCFVAGSTEKGAAKELTFARMAREGRGLVLVDHVVQEHTWAVKRAREPRTEARGRRIRGSHQLAHVRPLTRTRCRRVLVRYVVNARVRGTERCRRLLAPTECVVSGTLQVGGSFRIKTIDGLFIDGIRRRIRLSSAT